MVTKSKSPNPVMLAVVDGLGLRRRLVATHSLVHTHQT